MDERNITKLAEEAFEIYKRIKSDTTKLNSIKTPSGRQPEPVKTTERGIKNPRNERKQN